MPIGIIESLDHDARGIARPDGKTIFVEGALPGERVEFASYRVKSNYEIARVKRILRPSANRVPPRCPNFGSCGGCSMQHLDATAQLAAKQRVLENNLRFLGKTKAEQLFPAIYGSAWGYRQRARLSVWQRSDGKVLVGFHERKSSHVTKMTECPILPPHVSALIVPLRLLIARLSISQRLPQIEVAVGERVTVLVLRILAPLIPDDEALIRQFADTHGVVIYLQPKGPSSAYRFHPDAAPALSYTLPESGIEHFFAPTDFTQVNHAINRVLIRRALRLIDAQPGERIADLFCGLGNFTLPLARSGATVVGVEGNAELVQRAGENATANGLAETTQFAVANLFEATPESIAALGHFDKMLIDPPREGAIEVVKSLGDDAPRRIVYISCNPSTLARDTAVLVHQKNYRLRGAGVVNMFPHTSHVESIALFERG
ncbi:23S rRNA (uracil(1939)-C(5))-methyltransferase RlmD [Rhodocyclus gracilis]|uniref:23S rRNA (uracil(1939)-C(5))-methyltransferase RlmD n=1 Tax=Rhodocyclus tenuis TaxID=1066 RepID=A0A6L5JYV8_RHOTE|nr:23S rRNA (uracil(1939)-C(5))-methyltransferase RlmD [Rhodocyclus gracilis]MQY52012.1 23S rRNA (uracil(1939)-C(5))-methyltransferase RlmD [Rhodocyclus gracilis]